MALRWMPMFAAAVAFAGCQCGGAVTVPCSSPADCAPGQVCVAGTCAPADPGDGGPGSDGGPEADGGSDGGATSGCDPANPANSTLDTDCDGISDAEEYSAAYGGLQTDPCNPDTDGDGIPDGVELGRTSSVNAACGFIGDADPASKTDPTQPDSEGDGLKDGEEDLNHNGKVDPGESNPLRVDSDCDGISDFDEVKGTFGCASAPLEKDTDGDGIPDGVEAGVVAPGADASGCAYPAATFDTEAATKTNACAPDTDGDGIMDGAEDSNHNGKVDPGELDPKDAADGTGPAHEACSTGNLRPINFQTSGLADLKVALVPEFAEVQKLTDATGAERGIIFYDATNQIAGLVLSRPPVGADAVAEETDARTKLNGLGAVTAPITQTFTTWDGFAQTVRGTYDQAGSADLKARLNDVAKAFLGTTVTGTLAGSAGAVGPFKVQAEYIHRAATRSVLLFALVPAATFTGKQVFRVDDVAGGSAVAQYGDFAATQCEVFDSDGSATVDFLWVVDDSCSMAGYQAAIANAANLFAQKLATAGLDWRAGGVSTWYYNTSTAAEYRPFTNVTATMQSWFDQANPEPPWWGASGRGNEQSLQSAYQYIPTLLPKGTSVTDNKLRTAADLHLIVLGDADDQSATAIATLNAFFLNYDGAGSKATVHGIVCPAGQACGETQRTPRRNLDTIAATGGVLGDINVAQSGSPQLAATLDAILSAAIAGTGHLLQRPPISATLKIAIETGGTVGACATADVPRDRTSGFDFDSATRKVVFFGACRPAGAGKKVAVSYRYWNDATPDPAGDPCGNRCVDPFQCNPSTGQCECKPACGGCSPGLVCDMVTCACGPGIN